MNVAHLYKRFGDKVVLEDVSLTVPDGAVVCLMAPSGRGKTTLLRCIAGLEMPDSGTVTGVPERLGFVFQEDRLCPQLDAVENVRLVTGRAMSGRISRRTCGSWNWRTACTSGRRNCPADSGGGCPLPGRCVMCRSCCCWMSPLRAWTAPARDRTAQYLLRHRNGAAVLCVTHDRADAAALGAEIVEI